MSYYNNTNFTTGLCFLVDTQTSHPDLKISRDHHCVRSASSILRPQTAFGDCLLSDGVHYWKLRLKLLAGPASSPVDNFVALGISSSTQDSEIVGMSSWALFMIPIMDIFDLSLTMSHCLRLFMTYSRVPKNRWG